MRTSRMSDKLAFATDQWHVYRQRAAASDICNYMYCQGRIQDFGLGGALAGAIFCLKIQNAVAGSRASKMVHNGSQFCGATSAVQSAVF